MNKKRILFIVLLLLITVAVLLLFAGRENPAENKQSVETALPEQEETKAETEENKILVPDFSALDSNGNSVRLHDYLGKPIVLNFWASWCGPCCMEMPHFEEAYKSYGEEINFLMVNLTDGSTETVETASDFISEQGYTFPVLFDAEQEAAYTYGIYSIPVTYFIDAEGYPVAQARGSIDSETLQMGLDMIFE